MEFFGVTPGLYSGLGEIRRWDLRALKLVVQKPLITPLALTAPKRLNTGAEKRRDRGPRGRR